MVEPLPPTITARPSQELATRVGEDNATALIRAGRTALRGAVGDGPGFHASSGDFIVASVLAGVFATAAPALARAIGEAGVLDGARAAIRDAELAAVADTLRVAFQVARDARAQGLNPVHAIIAVADTLRVDVNGNGPAAGPADDQTDDVAHLADVIVGARLSGINAGGYTLARAILAAGYTRPAETAPAGDPVPFAGDEVAARTFNAVTRAAARSGRFVPLSERKAIAEQVVADLRAAGVIA